MNTAHNQRSPDTRLSQSSLPPPRPPPPALRPLWTWQAGSLAGPHPELGPPLPPGQGWLHNRLCGRHPGAAVTWGSFEGGAGEGGTSQTQPVATAAPPCPVSLAGSQLFSPLAQPD